MHLTESLNAVCNFDKIRSYNCPLTRFFNIHISCLSSTLYSIKDIKQGISLIFFYFNESDLR